MLHRLLPRTLGERLLAALTALITVTTCVAGVTMGSAAAIGTTHHLVSSSKSNSSAAVEKVSSAFTCNGTTGFYTWSAHNIQPIETDHQTRWTELDVAWILQDPTGANSITDPLNALVQNDTNGLFNASSSGHIDPSLCQTGSRFELADSAFSEALFVSWTLS
jgi:hypothetical protein